MFPPPQARRSTRVHCDRQDLPLGACALFAAWTMGEGQSALCAQCRARGHEQSHHLDPLLWSTRVLSSLRVGFHARALSRAVCVRTAAVLDLVSRETRGLARALVATGSACVRMADDSWYGRSFLDRDEEEMERMMSARSAGGSRNATGMENSRTGHNLSRIPGYPLMLVRGGTSSLRGPSR